MPFRGVLVCIYTELKSKTNEFMNKTSKMGQKLSFCCPQRTKEVDCLSERSYLLCRNSATVEDLSQFSATIISSQSQLFGLSDEQNQLNNNFDKICDKMIDIPALNRPPIDKYDYKFKEKKYKERVENIKKPLVLKSMAFQNKLNKDIKPKERPFELISSEDTKLIEYFSSKATEAVVNGFKIVCEDSLVVEFKP